MQKTSGIADGKFTPKPSVQNSTLKIQPSPQAVKLSATSPPSAARSVSALIAAAGLPMDKLSAAIISFARFFSLPLKPELMAAMRRQALAPSPSTAASATVTPATENAPDLGTVAKNREALSLAAAAAESKGVGLDPKGLEQFAEAIYPDWQKRQNPDERNRRQHKNSDEQEKENAVPKTGNLSAAGIKEMALETAEKNPLLALLNRLPGKNGQRWLALPFSFSEGGREFKVSLRILLEMNNQISNHAVCMTLDIAESETGRRWLFILNGPNRHGKSAASALTVYLQPELSPKACASLSRELSTLMEIPPERVSVKNRTESFPWESGCTDDVPLAINEAV
ncbi:MAG: hypothetical protein LBB89_03020 [Treponema sp.]|nr:hypothetical protein [Treponema sp.]